MTKEKKELNTIMSYSEKLSTSFSLTIAGMFLLVISFITLLIAQGMFIYKPDYLSDYIYYSVIFLSHLISFLLMFLSMKMILSIAGMTKTLFPKTQKKLIFTQNLIVFITSLNIYFAIISVIWLFIRPSISLAIFIMICILWIKMRKIKKERAVKIEEELAKMDEKTFNKVSEMIDDTYTDVSNKVDTAKNIIDKIRKL